MERDRNIDWIRKRIYIPVVAMGGYQIDVFRVGTQGAGNALQELSGTIGTTAAVGNTNLLGATAATPNQNARSRGIGNGTPVLVPITGLNRVGLLVVNANDGIEFDWLMPYDLDITKTIGFRCWWTSEAAAVGARTITWQVKYSAFKDTDTLVAAANALDTTIAAHAPFGTSKALQRGLRGIINGSSANISQKSFLWSIQILMSAFNAAFTENKYLLGLEIDYMLRKTYGPGMQTGTSTGRDPLVSPFGPAQTYQS